MKLLNEKGMKIFLKDESEIAKMREGGKILGEILDALGKMAKAGMTTLELDQHALSMMHKHNVIPSFKGYHGFPGCLCTSVNEQVVHGIPGPYVLKEGDILTIDCGVIHKGLHTDSAITIGIGKIKPELRQFIDTVSISLDKAIDAVRPGIKLNHISGIIEDTVTEKGYSPIRDMVGHGIGKDLHEDPCVFNFRNNEPTPVLQAGMTIAIEPIVSMGDFHLKTLKDGWTTVTSDGSIAAQQEHTIVITEDGAEILTLRPSSR